MTNIILCGGVGSRLWPLSRSKLPKQFARLMPGDTLFEATVRRNRKHCSRVMVASNAEQAHLAARQLAGMSVPEWDAVVEPIGRNTAPAIALSCMLLPTDEIVLISPSDHVIADQIAYDRAIETASQLARSGKVVTFGIKPEYPETGFGYIECDPVQPESVLSFREKPDITRARTYLKAGNYYWNSGMFCFSAGVFLHELELHAPTVYRACRRTFENANRTQDGGIVLSPELVDMSTIDGISIDYAVMEHSANVAMVPCDIGWSDLGSFDALFDHMTRIGSADDDGNAISTGIAPVLIESRNNLVISGTRTVALVDVDDLIVVETADALLVTRRDSSQRVKDVVDKLKLLQSDLT